MVKYFKANLYYYKAVKIIAVIIVLSVIYFFFNCGGVSKEAFINGQVTNFLSPLPGKVILADSITPGKYIHSGDRIGSITTSQANDQIPNLISQKSSLEIQLVDIDKQITGIDQRVKTYQLQREQYLSESKIQYKLGEKLSDENSIQLKEELKAVIAQASFSSKKLQSYKELFAQHYISRIEYEQRISDNQVLQANLNAKKAELHQSILDLSAAQSGLQLTGSRTLDAPQQNQRDIALTIENLQQERFQLIARKQVVMQSKSEVTSVLNSRQNAAMVSNTDGVIWNVNSDSGAIVQNGTPVLQVLNCRKRWVDAFFDEADANKIHPGMKVSVWLTNSPKIRWEGVVRTIRAGSGRVIIGERNTQPPPEIARRQLPVKVLSVHISIDWKGIPDASNFCFAGRSVTVKV